MEFLAAAPRRAGFDGPPAFGIVLLGEPTAYPDGVPYPRILKEGDVVPGNVGAPLQGYVSDLTRSYVFGTPTPRQREIRELTNRAHSRARPASPVAGPVVGEGRP